MASLESAFLSWTHWSSSTSRVFTFAGWFTTGDPRVARLHTVDCLRAMMLPWTSVIVPGLQCCCNR